MEAIHSSRARSGIYFQLGDEMESLMADNQDNDNSFTALLGLPANEAVHLLHQPESGEYEAEERLTDQTLGLPFNFSPTFPANAALFQRAARFSIFAGSKESPETTSSDPSNCSNDSHKLVTVKCEATDSDSNLNSTAPIFTAIQKEKRTNKRKEGGTNKVKGTTKRTKSRDEANSKTKPVEQTVDQSCGVVPDKLPYVHVRARRGQATDSHSLAERARREKINARMKLLQELVPGCNKISGTALVLDEIINHVQSLQRQVEILSMRLAAVNPGIGFSCENFLSQDRSCLTATNGVNIEAEQSVWAELQVNGLRRQNHQHQHLWQLGACGPDSVVPSAWERDHSLGFIAPDTSVPGFDPASSVTLRPNQQLKMEF